MEPETFLDAMARFPSGLVIVSTLAGPARFRGLSATSFASASLDPPLVLVCVDRNSATRDAIEEAARFNVSVLSDRQEFIAERFAQRAPLVDARWREIPHRLGSNDIPIVQGSIAWFECELERLEAAGDHDLVLGRVTEAGAAGGDPMLHWLRSFWRLSS